jgi:peptide/nickel transport system permease protein
MTRHKVVPGRISRWRFFARNHVSVLGAIILGGLVLVAVFGDSLVRFDANRVGVGRTMLPPENAFWMGTDELGRDVFSRVVAGTRISLLVGICAAFVSTSLGILVGSAAGFLRHFIDDILMRVTEIFQVIPRFFLAIMLVAFFGAHILNIILAISLLSWPEIARIVRAEFLSLKSRQYVDAARVAGAGTGTLIFFEILPNALGPVIVNATLQVGQAMLLEAGLSYLGLGDPNQVSLGLMLNQGQRILRSAWWATAFPGMVIFLAVLSLNLVGDGLNDVLNPMSRGR